MKIKYIYTSMFISILIILFGCFFFWKINFVSKQSNEKVKVIGIGVSYEVDNSMPEEQRYLYNKQFLRTRYIDQFVKACNKNNVLFVMIPVNDSQIDKITNFVDGMIFTGGDDINSKFFGEKLHPKVKEIEPDNRVKFDIKLIKKLMKKRKPILGICLGMQELNIAFGGNIIQDIPSSMKYSSNIKHKGISTIKNIHKVNIIKNSLLHKILNKKTIDVNSNHHQAVGRIADKFVVTAVAPDNIVEAIECKDCSNFVLGLQWHPEFLINKENVKIIRAFCDAV